MSDWEEPFEIELDLEDRAHTRTRRQVTVITGLGCGVYVGFGLWASYTGRCRGDFPQALALLILPWLLPFISMVFWIPRGAWRLGARGVQHKSRKGALSFLAWDDVEAIGYWHQSPRLRGGGQTIEIPLNWVRRDQRPATRALLQSHLGSAFDLRDSLSRPIGRQFLVRVVAGLAFSFAFAAIPTAAIVGYDYAQQQISMERTDVYLNTAIISVWISFAVLAAIAYRSPRRVPIWRQRHVRYCGLD